MNPEKCIILTGMNKKFLPVIFLLSLFLWACAPSSPVAPDHIQQTRRPEATPAPAPSPSLVYFGQSGDNAFYLGAKRAAEASGIPITDGGDPSQWAVFPAAAPAVLLLNLGTAAQAPNLSGERAFPILVYGGEEAQVPLDVPCLTRMDDDCANLALDAALSYSLHTTPVRMLGLFTSVKSSGFAAYKAASQDGRVYSRGAFFSTSREDTPRDFVEAQLASFPSGTLDCIVAESSELAVAAAELLEGSGRGEVEVFSMEADRTVFSLMETCSSLAGAAGIDEEAAGYACAMRAIALLTDAGDTAHQELHPSVHYGADRTNP